VRKDRASGDDTPPTVLERIADRKSEHPQARLTNFKACCKPTLTPASIRSTTPATSLKQHAGHARRKFHDTNVARPTPLTTEALLRIGELYKLEEAIHNKPTGARGAAR
jgi:hypothetical protein